MKVLFTGLGSIGRRHLQNLNNICQEQGLVAEVVALRTTKRALPDEVTRLLVQEVESVAKDEHFDIAFITGPTNRHQEVIASLAGQVDAFFIEKPIFDTPSDDLTALGLSPQQKAYVAAPMRWTGVYMALRQQLNALSPYSVRAICSSYLPSWRPDTDYREGYSAHRDMGGGVVLDLVHEWDYLIDLFGMPETTCAMVGKFSALEISSDDLAVYIARYPGFLCELHLDYFGREKMRYVEVFTHDGCIRADFNKGLLQLEGREEISYEEPINKRYLREIEYFLAYAAGDEIESVNSPARANQVLKVALGGQI